MTAVLITGALTGDLVGRCAPRRRPHEEKTKALRVADPSALAFGVMRGIPSAHAAGGQPAQSEATPSGEKGGSCCKTGDTTPPTELVKQVPKGQLHSPYPDYTKLAKDDPDLVKL